VQELKSVSKYRLAIFTLLDLFVCPKLFLPIFPQFIDRFVLLLKGHFALRAFNIVAPSEEPAVCGTTDWAACYV
jgi:hypothetical protein